MINEMISIVGLFLFAAIYAVLDGMRDGIDHYKGAKTLYSFWHFLKHMGRIFLFITGWEACNVQWWALVPFVFMLPVYKYLWDQVYEKRARWANLDDRIVIKTGNDYFDKLLGFDKQPPEEPFAYNYNIQVDHHLKLDCLYFKDLVSMNKPFEVRDTSDRDFYVGQIVCLQEYELGAFTGRTIYRVVSYVLTDQFIGVADGYCVLGLKKIEDIASI